MSDHPERFEDLPAELQEKLKPGPTRVHPRAQRAFGWAVACGIVVFLEWGGWIVAAVCAPIALLNGVIALRAIRTETGWHGRGLAWIGVAVAGLVVSMVVLQMLRMRGLYGAAEGN